MVRPLLTTRRLCHTHQAIFARQEAVDKLGDGVVPGPVVISVTPNSIAEMAANASMRFQSGSVHDHQKLITFGIN